MPCGTTKNSNKGVSLWLLTSLLGVVATSVGCSSGRYTTMYLNQLVHERAEQEVKLETMSLDLEAAQNTIMTLEMENQRLREASGELESKPLKKRRVNSEPEAVPSIDLETPAEKTKKETAPGDEVTSAPDSIPDLELAPMEEESSSPAVDAKQASLKRADEADAEPDAAPDEGGGAFLPTKLGAAKEPQAEEEFPNPQPSESDAAEGSASVASPALSLVFNKTETRGEDLDGNPGDEGVLVVLQPRDRAGKYAPITGSVIIEIVDSPTASKADRSAQVAEWKFNQDEVRRATRNSTLGRGTYLSVDWDEHRPVHSKLLIVARWKTASGVELSAEQVVKVNLSKGAQAWDSRLNGPIASDIPEISVATRPTEGSSSNSKAWAPSRR